MSVVNVQVAVEENTYKFAEALAKFGVELLAAVKANNGIVPEVIAIGTAAVQIPAELKDDKAAFAKAWELAGTDFVKAVLG